MNDNKLSLPRAVSSSHRRAVAPTHVELTWVERKIEHWLRCGHRAEEKIADCRRSISSFTPGSIFAFARWASNDYGTVVSRMDIVRKVGLARIAGSATMWSTPGRRPCRSWGGSSIGGCTTSSQVKPMR